MSGESPQDGTVARHEAHLLHKHESNGMLPAARVAGLVGGFFLFDMVDIFQVRISKKK